MPTRNVNLTTELERFVTARVKSGRYDNASEVVRAGLRALERDEQEHAAKVAALRKAIDEGDASGIAPGDVFARVRKSLRPRERPSASLWPRTAFPSAQQQICGRSAHTIRKWGEDQAVRYLDDLEGCCDTLAANALLGRACDDIRPGLRRMECGAHVVFYRKRSTGILVSRILHRRMLPERRTL